LSDLLSGSDENAGMGIVRAIAIRLMHKKGGAMMLNIIKTKVNADRPIG
jgi:hypothetical protein